MMLNRLQVRKRRSVLAAALILVSASAAFAAREPFPVSPGHRSLAIWVETPCPSFSWSAGGLELLELAVWPLSGDPDMALPVMGEEPLVRVRLPGTARVWTPALEDCLPLGSRFAWSVREIDAVSATAWAPPLRFEVPGPATATEIREALGVFGIEMPAVLDEPMPAGRRFAPAEAVSTPAARSSAVGYRASEAPQPRLPATADTTALFSEVAGATGVTFGVHGITNGTGTGSAGLIGQSTATSGTTYGVLGVVASPNGVAGSFENTGGGDAIRGLSAGVEVFSVDAVGTVTAVDFVGDGSQLFGAVSGLACTSCVDGAEIVDGTVTGSRLQSDSVDNSKIVDGAVNSFHIFTDAVGSSELATDSVEGVEIALGAVGASEIQANAVGESEIGLFEVETIDLANDSVTRSKIKGTEVELYEVHEDCSDSGDLTLSATCLSIQGSCPIAQFQNCSGGCTGAPQLCDNSFEGYLLEEGIQ